MNPLALFTASLGLLAGPALVVQEPGADPPRPPVVWVNPDLPEGAARAGLTHHVLASRALGHDVGYVVWLPPGGDRGEAASPAPRYPVIYFLHGMGGNESADAAGFSGRVAAAIEQGILPPVICVFPNGGRSGYRGAVGAMIAEELVPLIDRSCPTIARREARAIAGFSMGGAGAMGLLLERPELFCAAASWGGAVREGDERLAKAAAARAPELTALGAAILQVQGERDRPEGARALARELERLGIESDLVVLDDTPHDLGLYYERGGERTMQFLGRRLQVEPRPRTLGVFIYPGFELLDVYGPLEMWGNLAGRVRIAMVGATREPVASHQGPRTLPDFGFEDCPRLDLLLVPGGFGAIPLLEDGLTLEWIRARARGAEVVLSVCNGASILAAAGLLDGRRATTNKAYWKPATAPGPRVEWVPRARWVEDGKFVTSSGVSAGMDMSLAVIARLFGRDAARSLAAGAEYEWHEDPAWDPFAAMHGLAAEETAPTGAARAPVEERSPEKR